MLNLRLGLRYVLHRFTANNRHGLHSPFVYRLVDSVIYDFRAKNAYTELKKIYHTYRNDQCFTLPFKAVQLLHRLVEDAQPAAILYSGVNPKAVSECLHLAAPSAVIHLLNDQPAAAKADLIYIVPTSESHVLTIFEHGLAYVEDSSVIIIQNIYQNPTGKHSWAAIKAHPQVTVTIDLFWLQLVYFRKGQAREDFKIRY